MKNLLATLVLFASISASFSAEIQCVTSKNSLLRAYPITAEGITLAKELKVKTCGGERFLIAAKKAGHTVKLVKVSQEKLIEVMAAKN